MLFKYELGQEVKDLITGYVGAITCRMDHITGCATYLVQRKYQKGEKIEDSQHFDENRLEPTGNKTKLNMPVQGGEVKAGAVALPKGMRRT